MSTTSSCHGKLDKNPVEGLFLSNKTQQGERLPFTVDQLKVIFDASLFTSCASRARCHLPGSPEIRNHRYLLPFLALVTGARLGELAQLLVTDLEQHGDRWIIHITERGGNEKALKNEASESIIPVHRRLEELGFIRHVQSLDTRTSMQVFPEVKRNSRGQAAATFLRSWGKFLENIGVKTDAKVTFHYFRHTVADELRRAGFTDDQIGTLLGHSKQGRTARYGALSEGTAAQRMEMVDVLKFVDLF